MNLGFTETVVLVAIALLLFGPKKLSELARALGNGMREFNNALHAEEKPSDEGKDGQPRNTRADRQ